jgi:hypothetical protein
MNILLNLNMKTMQQFKGLSVITRQSTLLTKQLLTLKVTSAPEGYSDIPVPVWQRFLKNRVEGSVVNGQKAEVIQTILLMH